ncbi:MAG: peptidylprolyl isomerase, partial [Muribaculaceae bacterium]|nr:peptidylprolyl isomerase [Muribaculaceae bacterium]
FGEVLEGMETVEKIQKAETDGRDRPLEDIRILSIKVEE